MRFSCLFNWLTCKSNDMEGKLSRLVILSAGTFLLSIVILSMVLAVTEDLAPLQTSEITELGVCLQNHEYLPVRIIPAGSTELFICGTLSGTTKRGAWFNVLSQDRAVAQASTALEPGPFFVANLQWFAPLIAGDYRIEAGYVRPAVISSRFSVR
jgi:hypothetical protein